MESDGIRRNLTSRETARQSHHIRRQPKPASATTLHPDKTTPDEQNPATALTGGFNVPGMVFRERWRKKLKYRERTRTGSRQCRPLFFARHH
ncbi:hypothetical protein FZH48_19140 [Salmonella enterica]|nr:hypothetical protein [Salmonella enterica]ECP3587870.1 hypothetical protein [Salmonella enterica]EGH3642240.1 hypothetical protein [Salmonella enterica]EGH3645505.1 hypothetical protein [Salmonella enterica]